MHIYMYDPRHEVCVGLGRNPEDRFAHDAAHFFHDLHNYKCFFTIAKTLQEILHLS